MRRARGADDVVDRSFVGSPRANQVDVEQVAPQVEVGGRVRRHELDQHDLRLRSGRLPRLSDAVARVAIRLAAGLVNHVERRRRAAPPVLRIGEDLGVPVERRAREEARPARRDRVMDRREQSGCLIGVDEADRACRLVWQAEGTAVAGQRDAGLHGAQPVAEALVDAALRGPQDREWLARFVDRVELEPHHPPQDSPSPMRRMNADDRYARRRQHAPGHGEVIAEAAGRAHDAVSVVRRDGPIGLEQLLPVGDVLGVRALTEGQLTGLEERLRVALEASDLDFHPPIMARDLLYHPPDVPDRRRERARSRAGSRHPGDHRAQRPGLHLPPGRRRAGGRRLHLRVQRGPV